MTSHAKASQESRRRGVAVCLAAFAAALLCLTSGLLGAAGAGLNAAPSGTSATHCSVNTELVPNCGDLWGEAVPNTGSDLVQAVSAAELQTQRTLDIVHTYHRWLQAFPTPEETVLARSGHVLLINWQPTEPDGHAIPWSAIADGLQDTAIKAEALRLAALDLPVMVSFSHEPEADLGKEGTAAEIRRCIPPRSRRRGRFGRFECRVGLGRGGSRDPSLGTPLPRALARIGLRRLDRLGSLQLRFVQGAAVAIVRKAGVALLPLDRIATLWTPSSDVGRVWHCRRSDRSQHETSLVRGNTRISGEVPGR